MKTDVETPVHYMAQTPISSSPELMRDWGKLHNECFPNLYFLGHIIRITSRRNRWVGHVARAGDNRSAYNVLVAKPEGKGLLGRCTRWWEGNIKMEYKQTGLEYVGWIYLAQARYGWQTTAKAEMNLWVLWSAKNFFNSGSPVSFSRTTYFLAVSFQSNFQQRFFLWRARDCAYVKWLNLFLFENNTVFFIFIKHISNDPFWRYYGT
jgi:hypothetical protein